MANQSPGWNIVVIIFAVIGMLAVVAMIGMWLMHGSMMGRMSDSPIGHSLASICSGMMARPHS